jgi:antitoxin CptB
MTDTLEHRRRRARFRANHRGTKEVDWLVGRYAEAHLDIMDEERLALFERFLMVPDPEIHAWLMGGREADAGEYHHLVAQMRAWHKLK